jgi:hypothetical protein
MEGSVLSVERILSQITSIVRLVSQRILIMDTKRGGRESVSHEAGNSGPLKSERQPTPPQLRRPR